MSLSSFSSKGWNRLQGKWTQKSRPHHRETSLPFATLPLQQVAPAGLGRQQVGLQHGKQAQVKEGVLGIGVESSGSSPFHNSPCSLPPGFKSLQITPFSQEENTCLAAAEFLACPGKALNPAFFQVLLRGLVKKTQSSLPTAPDPTSPKCRSPELTPRA